MPIRNERPIFEGKNRRLEDRRRAERRKSSSTGKRWKYIVIALFIVVFIIAFTI
jgi:hypothetical protein